MDKTHDQMRAELKARLKSLMPEHGDAAAVARESGIPKTSVYTWIGDIKKAVPDAIDLYFLSRTLKKSMEFISSGEDPSGLPPRILELARLEAELAERDIALIESVVSTMKALPETRKFLYPPDAPRVLTAAEGDPFRAQAENKSNAADDEEARR